MITFVINSPVPRFNNINIITSLPKPNKYQWILLPWQMLSPGRFPYRNPFIPADDTCTITEHLQTHVSVVCYGLFGILTALLTMHLIALNKVLIIFKVPGWVCDVRLDIIVQIPAEVLI